MLELFLIYSIQITLAARLEKFILVSLAGLTATDELDLSSLGEKKVALFVLIPDNDTSFNFLISILYTQLFQQPFSWQIGLSLKSHDPSQRANSFLTLPGGVVITFAKEILTLITG